LKRLPGCGVQRKVSERSLQRSMGIVGEIQHKTSEEGDFHPVPFTARSTGIPIKTKKQSLSG